MKKRMNNKGIALSIFIFVLGVGVLLTMSIVVYQRTVSEVNQIISVNDYADNIEVKQLQLNYHIQTIVNKVSMEFDGTSEDFIVRVNDELEKLKNKGSYLFNGLNGINEQLTVDHVVVTDSIVSLTLDLTVTANKQITPEDHINAQYTYKKRFEKVFKEAIV